MSAVQTVRAPVSFQPDPAYGDQFLLLGNTEARQTNNSLDDALSSLHRMVGHHHVSNLQILVGDSSAESKIFQEFLEIISSPNRPD